MRKLIFLILLSACSLSLPAYLPKDFESPKQVTKNGKQILIYTEQIGNNYTILGIHPLSGREFLIRVDSGEISEEEYGFIFSKGEIKEILRDLIKKP